MWCNNNGNRTIAVIHLNIFDNFLLLKKTNYRKKCRLSSSSVNNLLVLCSRHFCEIRTILHYLSTEIHSENDVLFDSRGAPYVSQQTGTKGSGI